MIADRKRAGLPGEGDRAAFRAVLGRPVGPSELGSALRLAYLSELMAEADRRERAKAAADAAQIGRGLRILIAEDNLTNQKVIAKLLERAGHEGVVVADGQQALDRLGLERFDVALMDINMPVLGGIEAAKRYRASLGAAAGVPIVALTADATADARRRCEAAGMRACLTKPIEPGRLFQVIATVLAGQHVAARPHAHNGDRWPALSEESGPSTGPSVDFKKLEELERLGGRDFVAEILAAFLADSRSIVDNLRLAVTLNDVIAFQAHMHAMRSCAANVGAIGLYRLSLDARRISEAELELHGLARLEAVDAELGRARRTLETYGVSQAQAACA
jgi:two-component system sensor histidine kinase RpfC